MEKGQVIKEVEKTKTDGFIENKSKKLKQKLVKDETIITPSGTSHAGKEK